MILEILSLEALICFMDSSIKARVSLPAAMRRSTAAINSAASVVLAAFWRVIEVISSAEAEVSSSDEACSDAPCASVWLAEATWVDPEAICSAPSERLRVMSRSCAVRPRTTMAMRPTTASPTMTKMTAIQRAEAISRSPVAAVSVSWAF